MEKFARLQRIVLALRYSVSIRAWAHSRATCPKRRSSNANGLCGQKSA